MQLTYLRKAVIDYPSGSALEYRDGILYVIGDDVNYILCLDEHWEKKGEIKLFDHDDLRIPKPDKPDLECATIIGDALYVIGSGSKSPQRDVAFVVNLADAAVRRIRTTSFYSLFRDRKLIVEMNIEGFTNCKDKLLFFNRGNTQQPNQLIITDQTVLKKRFPERFKVIPIQIGKLHDISLGISGACYDAQNDILFLTASAEDTDNAYDDGEIIGSGIGVMYDTCKKIEQPELVIDELIELDKIHDGFIKQKIESICITQQSAKKYTCVLVADNDDGRSVLFEIEIEI